MFNSIWIKDENIWVHFLIKIQYHHICFRIFDESDSNVDEDNDDEVDEDDDDQVAEDNDDEVDDTNTGNQRCPSRERQLSKKEILKTQQFTHNLDESDWLAAVPLV
jgi:hypothetical protein